MKSLILILAHQDDEFGVYSQINSFKNKKKIYVFYMTSGFQYKISKVALSIRDKESLKVLNKLGIKKNNIFFIGRSLGISANQLHNYLNIAYQNVLKFCKKIKGQKIILSHSLEGGHEDHDACFYLTKKILKSFDKTTTSFQFSLYNGKKMPFIFYRVFSPISENGKIINYPINFLCRLKFIYLLFFYKSQIKIWIGLYPFIIYKYLFNKINNIQVIKKNNIIKRPHKGKLLYEKRNFLKYNLFKKNIRKFYLNQN